MWPPWLAPATFWCCYGCRCYGVHDDTCRGSDTVITPPPAPAPAPVPPPDDDTFIDDDEDDEDETDTTAAPKQAHGNQRRSVFPFKRGAHPPVLRPPGHVVHLHASDVSPGECLFIPASMLAQGGVGAPDVQSENAPVVIPPDDILHVAATPSTIGRPTSSSATVVPPDARHDCRVAGCPRRPLSDPSGMRQIFGLSDRDDLCPM